MNTVRIPADIDQEDRLLGGLTARQLVLVVLPAIGLWALYLATRRVVPLVVFAPFAVIISGVVGTLVVAKRDGLTMDRFVIAALRHHRSPHCFVPLAADASAPGLTALSLPVSDVDSDGIVDLGSHGMAMLCHAESVNLALHSQAEQEALTGAFGRFCNALQESVQFVVHAEPVDLGDAVQQLRDKAPSLPSIGLERTALDHASFLSTLASRHDVLRRQTFVVFRTHDNSDEAAASLLHKAHEATLALRGAGVNLRVLDGPAAIDVIQRATTPTGPRRPFIPGEITTGVGT